MIKKINILIAIVLLITCFAGCGGSSSPVNSDHTVTNSAILTLLNNYETAVEAYYVDGMLGCLDSSSFTLTINEGSQTETKDYSRLKSELELDEDNQLAWRKSPTQDLNGHNYKLDLRLGTPTSSNETSIGAVVKQTFQVWESSDEINPAIETDSGTIVWTLVQNIGEWKATAMVISYNTVTSAALLEKELTTTGSKEKGFGFGKKRF